MPYENLLIAGVVFFGLLSLMVCIMFFMILETRSKVTKLYPELLIMVNTMQAMNKTIQADREKAKNGP